MYLLSHPTGNIFVRHALQGLHSSGLLHRFFTTLSFTSAELDRLPERFARELGRRSFEPLPAQLICKRPFLESLRLLNLRVAAWSGLAIPEWPSADNVYYDLDRHVAAYLDCVQGLSGVYCYEDGALETFRAAKRKGLQCIYDLPIAHWQLRNQLLKEESERLPAWACTMQGQVDKPEKLARKTQELELADLVVCNSEFTYSSLPEPIRRLKNCVTALYGSDPPRARACPPGQTQGPLKVLFAGQMSQRKGLGDLFAAMNILNRSDVQLIVMGTPVVPMDFYRSQYADFVYEPPRPRSQVLDLMATCDVFVFPSIVEGRGLVQSEAMSAGLPLVTTFNAASSDLIVEGQTGFLVPIRSPDVLATKIAWFADHRAELPRMSEQAQAKVAQLSWQAYEDTILTAIAQQAQQTNKAKPAL